MRSLLFLFAAIIGISCGESRSAKVELERNVPDEAKQRQNKKDVVDRIKENLLQDGFALDIDTIYHDSLSFKYYDDALNEIESIELYAQSISLVKAKATTPLKGTDFYPRLKIQEVYFADKIVTDSLIHRIKGIINSKDLINEKIYDKIIKIDDHYLLYILTDAKVFEKYVDKYGEILKEYKLQTTAQ